MASGSKKVIYAALIGNTLISITKFSAAAITGSSAMLSEGIHSLVDTGNQILLLHGLKQAKKPADENFPFGHGKEVYFWSGKKEVDFIVRDGNKLTAMNITYTNDVSKREKEGLLEFREKYKNAELVIITKELEQTDENKIKYGCFLWGINKVCLVFKNKYVCCSFT